MLLGKRQKIEITSPELAFIKTTGELRVAD